MFGAVYIHAAPEAYVLFAHDFDRLRKVPSYLALGVFSSPPQLSDLKDFSFDSDDIQVLERCKPGNCLIQGPSTFSRIQTRGLQTLRTHFYRARVKFGLKPTLRIVHAVTLRGKPTDEVAYAVAEKQLYSSHYFETALDLSLCIRGSEDLTNPGFYLIMAMASEQAGLTGLKGSIVREAAVGRSVSSLRDALTTIKSTLESR